MNTLTFIKKQIEKAAALHDAQIAMTSYRGVKFECKQGKSLRLMALSAIAVIPTPSDVMEAFLLGSYKLFKTAYCYTMCNLNMIFQNLACYVIKSIFDLSWSTLCKVILNLASVTGKSHLDIRNKSTHLGAFLLF